MDSPDSYRRAPDGLDGGPALHPAVHEPAHPQRPAARLAGRQPHAGPSMGYDLQKNGFRGRRPRAKLHGLVDRRLRRHVLASQRDRPAERDGLGPGRDARLSSSRTRFPAPTPKSAWISSTPGREAGGGSGTSSTTSSTLSLSLVKTASLHQGRLSLQLLPDVQELDREDGKGPALRLRHSRRQHDYSDDPEDARRPDAGRSRDPAGQGANSSPAAGSIRPAPSSSSSASPTSPTPGPSSRGRNIPTSGNPRAVRRSRPTTTPAGPCPFRWESPATRSRNRSTPPSTSIDESPAIPQAAEPRAEAAAYALDCQVTPPYASLSPCSKDKAEFCRSQTDHGKGFRLPGRAASSSRTRPEVPEGPAGASRQSADDGGGTDDTRRAKRTSSATGSGSTSPGVATWTRAGPDMSSTIWGFPM